MAAGARGQDGRMMGRVKQFARRDVERVTGQLLYVSERTALMVKDVALIVGSRQAAHPGEGYVPVSRGSLVLALATFVEERHGCRLYRWIMCVGPSSRVGWLWSGDLAEGGGQ